jgi:hypothetical protein
VKYTTRNPVRVFRQDSAGRNRFSLMELLNLCPKSLQPDWSRAVIKRLEAQTLAEKSLPCQLPVSDAEPANWRDLPLEWGDIVEIPERVALVGDKGDQRLPAELLDTMIRCASRKVSLEIHGKKTELPLTPEWPELQSLMGLPLAGEYDRKDLPRNTREPFVRNFWLLAVLHSSGRLLNTSDPTRVRVLRQTDGTTQEFVYNLETVAFPDDLWLQDGDTIVVPDRE